MGGAGAHATGGAGGAYGAAGSGGMGGSGRGGERGTVSTGAGGQLGAGGAGTGGTRAGGAGGGAVTGNGGMAGSRAGSGGAGGGGGNSTGVAGGRGSGGAAGGKAGIGGSAGLAGGAGRGGSQAGGAGGGAAGAGGAASLCLAQGVGGARGTILVPIAGQLAHLLIDSSHGHVYVSNMTLNQIEDYSVASCTLGPPIPVGAQPQGFDITPDASRLYVANSGGTNISVVDLGTRHELKKINVVPNFANDRPFSLAIASNDKALFSTTFGGSGFGGRVLSLDLTTEAVTARSDFFIGGTTTEATVLTASPDRSAIAAVAGDISSGPVFLYETATDAFSAERDLNEFVYDISASAAGTTLLVAGAYVLDDSLNLLGTIQGGSGLAAALAPSGSIGYRASTSGIQILDPVRFLVTGTIPVNDTITRFPLADNPNASAMAVSSDGSLLALLTDHGLTLVDLR